MDDTLKRFRDDWGRLMRDLEMGKIILIRPEIDTLVNALNFGDPDWEAKWSQVERVLVTVNNQYVLQGEKPVFRGGDISDEPVKYVKLNAGKVVEVLSTRIRVARHDELVMDCPWCDYTIADPEHFTTGTGECPQCGLTIEIKEVEQ